MKKNFIIITCALIVLINSSFLIAGDDEVALTESAMKAVDQGIAFFHSINTHGGYVYYVTTDLKERWGESRTDEHTIEVQPPGTPAVGMTFLRANRVTGNPDHLKAAMDAAFALIRGQNELGGWVHTIRFNRPKFQCVSFDDDQTQSAIRFCLRTV